MDLQSIIYTYFGIDWTARDQSKLLPPRAYDTNASGPLVLSLQYGYRAIRN